MYKKTAITLPAGVRDDEEIGDWLAENPDHWRHVLDLDVDYIDDRAVYLWHNIDDITVHKGRVSVRYTVEWDAHYGCDDMNTGGGDERETFGDLADGIVGFETFEQPKPSAPNEEL